MQSLPATAEPNEIRLPDQGQSASIQSAIDEIRTALSRANRHAEFAFVYMAERDVELTINLLDRYLSEARKVAVQLKALKALEAGVT